MLFHTQYAGGSGALIYTVPPMLNLVPGSPFTINFRLSQFHGSLAFLVPNFNISDFAAITQEDSAEYAVPGMRPVGSQEFYDGLWLRLMLRSATLVNFLRDDAVISDQHSVVHTNIVGKTTGSSWRENPLFPDFLLSETPDPQIMGYHNLTFTVQDGLLTSSSPTGLVDMGTEQPPCGVIGVHNDFISDRMNAGAMDGTYTYFYPIALDEGSCTFHATQLAWLWNGASFDGYLSRYVIRVRPVFRRLAPPAYYADGVHEVPVYETSTFMATGIQYSPLWEGYIITGLSAPLNHDDSRQAILNSGYLTPLPLSSYWEYEAYYAFVGYWAQSAQPGGSILNAIAYDPLSGRYYWPTHNHSFKRWDLAVKEALPSVIGGTYLSAIDAYDSFVKGVDQNFIETALELRAVLSPFEAFRQLREIPDLLKVGAGGVRQVLKILASADLAYKFGVVPTMQDAHAVADVAQRTLEILPDLSRVRLARGKVVVHLPDGTIPGFTECSAVFRTMATFNVEPDSLGSAFIKLDRLSVLPTFSRIWDLIPFSWLADYFVSLGDILGLVEKQALMLACSVGFSTSTVKIVHGLGYLKATYDFDFGYEGEPQYVSFSRVVLPGILPMLGPTSVPLFHTLEPSHLTKRWDILGSVLVQKF